MALLALLIPLGLLGLLVALGRYEELMLPRLPDEDEEPADAVRTAPATGTGTRPAGD